MRLPTLSDAAAERQRPAACFVRKAPDEHRSRRSAPAEQVRAGAVRRIAEGQVHLWDDAAPKAMAAWGRPTTRGVSVNAVYTPPPHRGRGFATALVAALSRKLLAEGRSFCALFTDLANPTSNAVYARIGYRPVRDFAHYHFESE
jgi:predicted GNAT family acetyltransferase